MHSLHGGSSNKPTSWKFYKEFYEAELGGFLGYPASRWNARMFQKMTPVKEEDLLRKQQNHLRTIRETIRGRTQHHKEQQSSYDGEIARLKGYTMPGVQAVAEGEEAIKKFPVDLSYWRYEDEVKKRIEQQITHWQDKLPENAPDNVREIIEEMIEHSAWKQITVKVSTEGIRQARASWHPTKRTLWVKIPYEASPWTLKGLGGSVRHELQHMAQTLMGESLDMPGVWKELQLERRLPRPGMPSRHIMTPEFLQRSDSKALMRRLKSLGVNPKNVDIHALDDIEFYTRLADAIDWFKRMEARHNPGQHKRTMIKLYTAAIPYPGMHGWGNRRFRNTGEWAEAMEELGGYDIVKHYEPSSFFKTLKKLAVPKWKKAVGEFVKAVT